MYEGISFCVLQHVQHSVLNKQYISLLMVDNAIGKLLFAGFECTHFTENGHAARLIKEHCVHCFILKKRNFINGDQFTQLLEDMQRFARSLGYESPLLLSVDYEMYEHCAKNTSILTRFPSPLAMAAGRNTQTIYKMGIAIGFELRSIGINMFQGPLLDISSRSMGDTAQMNALGYTVDEIVLYSKAFGSGLKAAGILTMGAHFPGLGSASYFETKESLVLMDQMDLISELHSRPFQTMLNCELLDVVEVTTASIYNSEGDDLVCCLTPNIVNNLLRTSLNCDKLVVTECLETQEIFSNLGKGQAAVFAILYASCDMVTVCNSFQYQREVLNYLKKSFDDNNFESNFNSAFTRVNALLSKLTWIDQKPRLNDELKAKHKFLSDEAYKASICLVNDFSELIPIVNYLTRKEKDLKYINFVKDETDNEKGNLIFLFTPEIDDKYSFLKSCLLQHFSLHNCVISHAAYSADGLPDFVLDDLPKCVLLIFVLSDIESSPYQLEILKFVSDILSSTDGNLITISVSSPYIFRKEYPIVANTFLCTYDCTYSSMKYLAEIIYGETVPIGVVPGRLLKSNPSKDDMCVSGNENNSFDMSKLRKHTVNNNGKIFSKSRNLKPWIIDKLDLPNDMSVYSLAQSSTVDETYVHFSLELLRNYWEFHEHFTDSSATFVVRNTSRGVVYGEVTVGFDQYSKCGRILYLVVLKLKRRQGIGEALHKKAIEFLIKEKGCTDIALGCSFPHFGYLLPVVPDDFSLLFYNLNDNCSNIHSSGAASLVYFFKSMGWTCSTFEKYVNKSTQRYILLLEMENWKLTTYNTLGSNGLEFSLGRLKDFLRKESIKFILSDDGEPARKITIEVNRGREDGAEEESQFPDMYDKAHSVIEKDKIISKIEGKRRTTLIIYALSQNKIVGGCIVYTSNSPLSSCYPFVNTLKDDVTEVIGGITGLFVGSLSGDFDTNTTGTHFSDYAVHFLKLGLITTCINVMKSLDIQKTVIHNVNNEVLPDLLACGFEKHTEYHPCYGKQKSSGWLIE